MIFGKKKIFLFFKNNFTRIHHCKFCHHKSHLKPFLSYLPCIVRRKYFSIIFNVKKCALYLIKYCISFASDLRIPPHAGRPAVHADGGRHLLHADAERPGRERSLRRRRLARRRRHLHRKVFHRGRTFAGSDEKGTRGARKLTD
jgi:hypothetical protein